MWSRNYTKCLVQGHVSSTLMYKEEEYTYCVRCGKISLNIQSGRVDSPESGSQRITGEKPEMISIISISK